MKPTREEVLRLMRQASGGILTQVAEDPRCGYEIKVEELQTFAALLQADEGAVASHECNGELDPQLAKDVARMFLQYVEGFNGQKFDPIFDSPDRQHLAVALDYLQEAAAMLLNLSERVIPSGMQPPDNQPNSDHVAVISAEPETRLTAAQIAEIASWLDEASDDIDSWGGYASDYFAEKWNLSGAIQSYKDRATKVRALLAAQSGDCMTYGSKPMQYTEYIVMPKNAVQTEQPSLSDAEILAIADKAGFVSKDAAGSLYFECWKEAVIHFARLLAQRQDSKYEERFRWIEENCHTEGGGKGFTIFVPVDHEDIGCGIDIAIANGAPK